MVDMLCMHCLKEGSWEDEDCCPKCREKGHVSPWQVSQCPACNKDFFDKIDEIKQQIDRRKNFNSCLAHLQTELREQKKEIEGMKKQLAHLQGLSVHQVRF